MREKKSLIFFISLLSLSILAIEATSNKNHVCEIISSKKSSASICMISNLKHKNEFLFGSSNEFEMKYNHLFDLTSNNRMVFTKKVDTKKFNTKKTI